MRAVVIGISSRAALFAVALVAALATASSSPRLQPVATDSATARTEPTAEPTPQLATNPLAPWSRALAQVVAPAQLADGALPGGCAVLNGVSVCVPRVTVDGAPTEDVVALTNMISMATSGAGPQAPTTAISAILSEPTTKQAAVADAVEEELVYQEGLKNAPADAAQLAQTVATNQLQNYLEDPGDVAGIVPSGMTAQAYFLSATMVARYERALIINHERLLLSSAGTDEAAWFRQELPNHAVIIDGAPPTFSLADAAHLP